MARGKNYLEGGNCMDGVPHGTPAVVDTDIYHFEAETVHVAIVSQATGFNEQGSRRGCHEIDLLYGTREGASLSSSFFAHDNNLL